MNDILYIFQSVPVRAILVISDTSKSSTYSTVRDQLYDLNFLRVVRGILHGDTADSDSSQTNNPNEVAISFAVAYGYLTILNPLTGS